MSLNRLLSLIFALLLAGTASACGMGETTPAGYENAEVQHVFQHWSGGAKSPVPFLMVDVRTPEEYAEGHIKGAKLIPLAELEQRLAELPKDKQLYVYCRSGRRSVSASEILARAGFSRVENVLGGINAWSAAGYPVEK